MVLQPHLRDLQLVKALGVRLGMIAKDLLNGEEEREAYP